MSIQLILRVFCLHPIYVIMTSDSRLLTIGFVSGGSIKPVPDEVNGHTAADKVHFLFSTLLIREAII